MGTRRGRAFVVEVSGATHASCPMSVCREAVKEETRRRSCSHFSKPTVAAEQGLVYTGGHMDREFGVFHLRFLPLQLQQPNTLDFKSRPGRGGSVSCAKP